MRQFDWMESLTAVLVGEAAQGVTVVVGGQPEEAAREIARLTADRAPRSELAAARAAYGAPPVAIVSFDADRIKDYIVGTAKLAEMRGASVAVRENLSRAAVERWLAEGGLAGSCRILFAGGGSGIVFAPASLAGRVAGLLEERFLSETYGGTCTAVWEAFWPEELVWGRGAAAGLANAGLRARTDLASVGDRPLPFGAIVGYLGALLRRRKAEKLGGVDFAVLHGIVRRCDSCGLAPATWQPRRAEDEWLCERCAGKRKLGGARARGEAQSLAHIAGGAEDDRGGKVAVVHLDGNGMGSILERLHTPGEIAQFSEAVAELYRRCRGMTVAKLGLEGSDAGDAKSVHGEESATEGRYQAPVFGGDDLVLVVPASEAVGAVKLAMDYLNGSGRDEIAAKIGGPLGARLRKTSASCGFVVAPSHFPANLLFDYSETLLRSAKQHAYQLVHDAQGARLKPDAAVYPPTVDYLVLKDSSPIGGSPIEHRRRLYALPVAQGVLRLTSRPYLYEEFRRDVIPRLERLSNAGVSGAQLGAAARSLLQDPDVARLDLAYQVLVRNEKEWSKLLGDVERRRWLDFFLESDGRGGYRSTFFDVLDLWQAERR